jgi:LuxR family maltose regulon positive regulatory protein
MSASLLSTKLYIPPTRAVAVSRPRLTEKIISAMSIPGSFILLSGPAGFGKTTLLSEFTVKYQKPVAWLSLDEGDNDPIRFWTYLIAACQMVYPGTGESVLAMITSPQSQPLDTVPVIFINELDRLDRDLLLVLDDYHAIQNELIHSALLFLLEHLPRKLHLVISTRIDPPWPLARFRARNRLVEIRTRDLRFSVEEAVEFLNTTMGLSLSAQDVAALEARTEGWIAGLQLAALSMQGRRDLAGFIKAFTGSHIYVAEYLVEEVLHRQPEAVQTFLLQTSILDRLSAGLCEAVTGGQNAQAILTGLHQANLFVIPLDDENQWFRYHHLFADLLKARLQQSQPSQAVAELHQRAAAWYEQNGMMAEAIAHTLSAEDYTYAVRLVGKAALPVILQAYVRTVEDWLRAIPQSYIDESPQANMACAWLYLLRGALNQASPYVERLSQLFSTADSLRQDPVLQGEWLAIQSNLLNIQGKPAESRDLANQALQVMPPAHTAVRSMVLVNLATAYGRMLDYDHAVETWELLVQAGREAGDYSIEILGAAGEGQLLEQLGRLRRTFEIASAGIQRIETSGRSTPFSATLYGELGQVYYHWYQIEQARKYFLLSVQKSGHTGYSDPEIYYHIINSRISLIAGDLQAAEQEIQTAMELGRRIPPAMVREELIDQQVCVHLACGRLGAAQETLRAEGFSFESGFQHPELPPEANLSHSLGLLYCSALCVLLALAREKGDRQSLKAGLALADRLLAGELQGQHILIALKTLLLRAQVHAELGDETNSLADVLKALEFAEPEGYISIFVEQGAPVAGALRSLKQRHLLAGVNTEYVQAILAAFPGGKPESARASSPASAPGSPGLAAGLGEELGLVEPLTPREMEVLELIAAGCSNQDIAERLVITVSAVKKHSTNIYGKLNVSSRTQALVRARQLGLLSPTG